MTQSSPRKPPPKRRRILDPSTIVPVSVYSNKVSRLLLWAGLDPDLDLDLDPSVQVSSGLQLKLTAAEFSPRDAAGGTCPPGPFALSSLVDCWCS